MFSQNVDFHGMMPLLVALAIASLLAVAVDIGILARYMRYRMQMQQLNLATAEGPTVVVDTPSPTPPFATTWSLVHPFLGFQAVFVLANLLIAIPLVGFLIYAMLTAGNRFQLLLNQSVIYATIFGLFAQNALFVGVTAFFLKRYGMSLRSIGLRRPTVQQIALGIGLGVALVLLAGVIEAGTGRALEAMMPQGVERLKKLGEIVEAGSIFKSLPSFWLKTLFFLGGAVAAPIGEEVFFRGFVYNAFKRRLSVRAAIVLSGLAFALIHASPLGLIVIFPMGMLLAYVYERTGSLWVTITMHALNNGLAFMLLWLPPSLGR